MWFEARILPFKHCLWMWMAKREEMEYAIRHMRRKFGSVINELKTLLTGDHEQVKLKIAQIILAHAEIKVADCINRQFQSKLTGCIGHRVIPKYIFCFFKKKKSRLFRYFRFFEHFPFLSLHNYCLKHAILCSPDMHHMQTYCKISHNKQYIFYTM